MNYMATSINTSPVITVPAGAAIPDVRGHALVFDEKGNIILATEGATPVGIGIMTCGDQGAVAQGADVDVQIRANGAVCAGGAFGAGAALSVDANGAFVKATSGNGVAIALQPSPAAGTYVQAILKF